MVKVIGIGYLILAGTGVTMTGYSENQETDKLDIDFLFKTARWEKVHSVETKQYEVEKITQTAGVRGNEAYHEILDFLYYRVRDRNPQIPSKLAEKLNIQ
tara:strand:+ start:1028 stop:1327 length:300 start_codon:yes stop_codon:yes gene_type:complete